MADPSGDVWDHAAHQETGVDHPGCGNRTDFVRCIREIVSVLTVWRENMAKYEYKFVEVPKNGASKQKAEKPLKNARESFWKKRNKAGG